MLEISILLECRCLLTMTSIAGILIAPERVIPRDASSSRRCWPILSRVVDAGSAQMQRSDGEAEKRLSIRLEEAGALRSRPQDDAWKWLGDCLFVCLSNERVSAMSLAIPVKGVCVLGYHKPGERV